MDDIINIGAQCYRVYDWKKDSEGEWFIASMKCELCQTRLGWKFGLERFCPRCGAMLIETQNPEPPEEVQDPTPLTEEVENE